MSDSKSNETCFLCLDQVIPGKKGGRGRPSSVKVKVSSQGPKILLSYLLVNFNAKSVASTFENNILIAHKSGRLKLCHNCDSSAEKITQLHLQLEAHQLKIIDLLKKIHHGLNNSAGIKARKSRLEENGGLDGGRGGTLLEVFQDRMQRNFLSRRLCDEYEVRLEKLDNFGEHLRSQTCQVDATLGTVIKEEPADTMEEYVDFDSPSSPVDHEVNNDDYLQSSTNDFTIPKESSVVKARRGRGRPKKSSNLASHNRKRKRSYYHNWAPTKKRKAMGESISFGELAASHESYSLRRKEKNKSTSTVEIIYVEVETPESSKEGNKKIDDNPPEEKALRESDSDVEDENEPLLDAADDERDEDFEPKKMYLKRKKKPKKKKSVAKPLEPQKRKPSTEQKHGRMRYRQTRTRWACDICLEQIPFKKMQDHLQTHPQFEKFYFCNDRVKVKRSFGTFKGYIWHLFGRCSCPQSPSLACDLCPDGKTFDKKDLTKHLYEDHKLDHARPTCSECSQVFYDPTSLKKHELSEHPKPLKEPTPKKSINSKQQSRGPAPKRIRIRTTTTCWTCDICLERIPFKQMKDHLQTHTQFEKFYFCHTGVVENRKKVFGTFKGYVWHLLHHSCKTGSTLECALCSDRKTFPRRDLSKHLYEDHQLDHPRPTCSDCTQVFYDPLTLRSHRLVEHVKKFMCEQCSRTFACRSKLNLHIRRIHLADGVDSKYFQCAFCPRRFCSTSSLQYHEASVHTKDSLSPCPHCGKAMVESALKEHIKRVHGEKKFICRFCPKGFTARTHLVRHEESHIGEPKYKCPECPYAATTRTYLSRHVQIHGEPKFACEFCPKRFTLKRYWEDHLRTHTKEKPYQCDICLMSFNARNCLSSHRKKKHGLTPQARSLLEREALSSTGAALPGSSESVTRENLDVKQDFSITRQDMFILPDNPGT